MVVEGEEVFLRADSEKCLVRRRMRLGEKEESGWRKDWIRYRDK